MESYLQGRGFKDPKSSEKNSFQGFLETQKADSQNDHPEMTSDKPVEKEVIYEEEGCPKVEVISEDGRPTLLVIHLPDGRLLEIDCLY